MMSITLNITLKLLRVSEPVHRYQILRGLEL